MTRKTARKVSSGPDELGGSLRELEDIFETLRNLVTAAYERGGTAAKSRILRLASQGGIVDSAPGLGAEGKLKRAPRGAARRFVEKALSDGPKSIREIRDVAVTEVEKFLSYQTIRLELERGKAEKRYKKIKDKWAPT